MKNLVIIGASELQLPLIERANDLGYSTHAFAWKDGAVGLDKMTRFYDIDIKDIDKIYELFEASLMAGITKHTDIKPYVIETVNKLKEMKIKIGSTTGYTDMMMEPVLKRAKEQGYCPDCWYSPDATNHLGRPYPYMIFKNIQTLNVTSVKNVIKVGDTVSDIKEGLNAGVITIGVIEGSSTLGLNEEEFNNLDKIKKLN